MYVSVKSSKCSLIFVAYTVRTYEETIPPESKRNRRIACRVHVLFTMVLTSLTTSHEANCRCSRRRWSFLARWGSARSHRRLRKPRAADIAGRRSYRCFARSPVAAAARLSRIVSALSRICNNVTATIICPSGVGVISRADRARIFHSHVAQISWRHYALLDRIFAWIYI